MAVYKDLQAALETRLNTLSGLPEVAWENNAFTPVQGTSFFRAILSPAAGDSITQDRLQLNTGLFTVEIFVPSEKGTSVLNTFVDAVYDHFTAVNTVTSGSTEVSLTGINKTLSTRDEAWFKGGIEIQYMVYST